MNAETVIEKACHVAGQTLDRFMGRDSKREIAQVRQAVYHLLWANGWSQSMIARTVGRHHSSVQHGVDVAGNLLEYDRGFIRFYQQLKQAIK
jgi:chromosomal replication initiation ATPase DnaA